MTIPLVSISLVYALGLIFYQGCCKVGLRGAVTGCKERGGRPTASAQRSRHIVARLPARPRLWLACSPLHQSIWVRAVWCGMACYSMHPHFSFSLPLSLLTHVHSAPSNASNAAATQVRTQRDERFTEVRTIRRNVWEYRILRGAIIFQLGIQYLGLLWLITSLGATAVLLVACERVSVSKARRPPRAESRRSPSNWKTRAAPARMLASAEELWHAQVPFSLAANAQRRRMLTHARSCPAPPLPRPALAAIATQAAASSANTYFQQAIEIYQEVRQVSLSKPPCLVASGNMHEGGRPSQRVGVRAKQRPSLIAGGAGPPAHCVPACPVHGATGQPVALPGAIVSSRNSVLTNENAGEAGQVGQNSRRHCAAGGVGQPGKRSLPLLFCFHHFRENTEIFVHAI